MKIAFITSISRLGRRLMNAVVHAQAKEKEGIHLHSAGDILDPHELTQL